MLPCRELPAIKFRAVAAFRRVSALGSGAISASPVRAESKARSSFQPLDMATADQEQKTAGMSERDPEPGVSSPFNTRSHHQSLRLDKLVFYLRSCSVALKFLSRPVTFRPTAPAY